MPESFVISASPHIRRPLATSAAMKLVCVALLPAAIASVYFFGMHALLIIAVSVGTCVFTEIFCNRIFHKESTIADYSAMVTGILLAFTLPPATPLWMVAVGGFVAIFIAKQLFGGLGFNIFNPALAARAVLLASWPVIMTTWVAPVYSFTAVDAVTTATPLAVIKAPIQASVPPTLDTIGNTVADAYDLGTLNIIRVVRESIGKDDLNDYYSFNFAHRMRLCLSLSVTAPNASANIELLDDKGILVGTSTDGKTGQKVINRNLDAGKYVIRVYSNGAENADYTLTLEPSPTYADMFLGDIPGSLGETCKIALILGAILLFIYKVIDWRIPAAFIGTVALFSIPFGREPVSAVLSGGVILGAFFMATDLVTSPTGKGGKLIFGFGCGALTALIRSYGGFPEGVCYSILLMNCFVPLIDRTVQPRVFGTKRALSL